MSSCGLPKETARQQGIPVLQLKMLGRGEDAMRMNKRLRCAGRALGVAVHIEWDSGQYGDPSVYFQGKLLIDHLIDTLEIEKILQPIVEPEFNDCQ